MSNSRLMKMIAEGKIPNKGGVFIDVYNQSINEDIAGTITTRTNAGNMVYVTNLYENNPNPPSDKEGVHRNPDGGGYLTQVTPHRKLAEGKCKREGRSARHSPATAREY